MDFMETNLSGLNHDNKSVYIVKLGLTGVYIFFLFCSKT